MDIIKVMLKALKYFFATIGAATCAIVVVSAICSVIQ